MSKLWIDMTDLSKWKGHMTGVQRVIYEIAVRYHSSAEEVGYFIYDEKDRACYEIPFSTIDEIISTPVTQNESKKPSHAKRMVSGTVDLMRDRYDRLSDDTKKKIPASVIIGGKVLVKGTEKLARTTLHYIREARARQLNRAIRSSMDDSREIVLAEGDILFVIGASWDSKTKIFDLAKLKSLYKLKYVQVIHDVIPAFSPHLFGDGFARDFDRFMFESIANADLLLCVSEATKRQLLKLCEVTRIPVPSVEVIRLGDDYSQSSHPVRPKMDVATGEKFILCVGTYEVRKNHTLLYYAVREAAYKNIDIPKIIIVGRPGWLVQDLTYMLDNDPVVAGRIQYLGGVSDEEKTWLFQHCSFTIFPSVFEGWGLPVGESLYYGKPCLSSNISSMPEIGGDLVDYFSPFNSGECLARIVEYANDTTLHAKAGRIKSEYSIHLWDDTYRQVSQYLKAL